jgi:cell division protein FtsW (lipid II flippase)
MIRSMRPLELWLLAYSIVLFAAGSTALQLVRGAEWPITDFGVIVLFAALMVGLHLVLSARLGRADQALLPIVATLTALGLILVERLQPSLAPRQALWVVIGAAALVTTTFLLPRIDTLARYRYTLLILGLAVMAATMAFGIDPNQSGARLWLGFSGYYFQPSEIMKIVVAIFFASYLAEKRSLITHAPVRIGRLALPPLAYLAPLVLMWLLSMAILVWQRDLGAALLFYLVFLAMLYAATGRTYVGIGLLFLILGAFVAYGLFDHVQLRTRIWLDPWPYADGDAYQIVQAVSAYAAGGVIGSGLGYGYPEYVPAVFTDFVLAALGEELGLLGTLAVIALYLLFVHRAFRIALRASSDFGMLLAAGLGATLGLQAIVILAGTLRIIPITGITLPFMSYGGSSILANYVMVGLLLRISAEAQAGGQRG